MKRSASVLVLIASVVIALSAQSKKAPTGKIDEKPTPLGKEVKVELLTPWIIPANGKASYNYAINGKNCLSLITLEQDCRTTHNLDYGARVGVNWDIFQISSRSARTRMVDLGRHTWDETLVIPIVEPWPELAPGEKRMVTINASGDGHATAPLTKQVSSSIMTGGGFVRSKQVIKADTYSPVVEAIEGHIYLAHIVDNQWDYYLLIRADAVYRGERAVLSLRRVPLDPGPVIPQ